MQSRPLAAGSLSFLAVVALAVVGWRRYDAAPIE
ncbi:MAG TPA: GlyGly-CTERM sorting domain-containing protein [Candidatus Tenderia sp.]|nr:GlyGly-CTERM sorting domain-containing protein [Candidatus Tenderia sp.]